MLAMRPMCLEEADAAYDCMQDLPSENGFGNGGYGLSREEFENDFIPHCERYAKGVDLKPGHVPQSYYILFEDERAVGVFKFRPRLNDMLRNGAGHIGYGIRRDSRGRGLAKAGLAMLLDMVAPLIQEDEAYLSVNKQNPASLRVMLAIGAYIHHEDEDHYYTRIPLKR
jgi:predicted acetyltransferase